MYTRFVNTQIGKKPVHFRLDEIFFDAGIIFTLLFMHFAHYERDDILRVFSDFGMAIVMFSLNLCLGLFLGRQFWWYRFHTSSHFPSRIMLILSIGIMLTMVTYPAIHITTHKYVPENWMEFMIGGSVIAALFGSFLGYHPRSSSWLLLSLIFIPPLFFFMQFCFNHFGIQNDQWVIAGLVFAVGLSLWVFLGLKFIRFLLRISQTLTQKTNPARKVIFAAILPFFLAAFYTYWVIFDKALEVTSSLYFILFSLVLLRILLSLRPQISWLNLLLSMCSYALLYYFVLQ